MIGFRCTHKFIIGGIHQIPNRLNLSYYLIHELLRCLSGLLRLTLYLLSMLVSTGHKEYIIAFVALKSSHRIRKNNFIGISNMRFSRCIGNRRGNIIRLFFHRLSFFN